MSNNVKKYNPAGMITWGPIRFNMTKGDDRRVYQAIKEHEGYSTESKFIKGVIIDYLDKKEAAELRQARKQQSQLGNLPTVQTPGEDY